MVATGSKPSSQRAPSALIWASIAASVLCLALFLLPWVYANYGGAVYAVRGLDLITGRAVQTDPFGMIPQLGAVLSGLLLVASIAVRLHRNRDKGTMLACIMAVGALVSALLLIRRDDKQAVFDPIIAGFGGGGVRVGYWLAIAALVLNAIVHAIAVWRNRALRKDLVYSRYLYLIALPVFIYVIVFFYYPIYGVVIAFKEFSPRLGILGSPFVGFKNFQSLFGAYFFRRIVTNTLIISLLDIAFGFTIPIVLALMLNELRSNRFKRTVQTMTYLPHFISLVVLCGLVREFTSKEGLINGVLMTLGVPERYLFNYLMEPKTFRAVYTASGVWQSMGWNSIVYLAALTAIDPSLYEAGRVDGARRWRLMWNITIPGILPTIITLFILRLGSVMSVGFEKIILLYNEATYDTADVISSYVYRRGIVQGDFSFATAVDLFNQLINLALVVATNAISRKVSEISLW